MKTTLLTLLLSVLGVAAQERYVTLAQPYFYDNQNFQHVATNTLEIVSGETAHLVSLVRGTPGSCSLYVEKDGARVGVYPPTLVTFGGSGSHSPTDPLVVNGPARLLLVGSGGMATLKITPDQYPPDRTVVVPGGPGGATVTMECSTNLVNWVPATSGVYTNLPGVKFFRIKLDRIQP